MKEADTKETERIDQVASVRGILTLPSQTLTQELARQTLDGSTEH